MKKNILWLLVKSRFQSIFYSMFMGKKKGKKKSGAGMKILGGILAIYVLACLFGVFGMMYQSICEPFFNNGLGWLYYALTGLVGIALCFIGSLFAVQKELFEAEDNEFLISMPIRPGYILLSRLVSLLLINLLWASFAMWPSLVIYIMFYGFQIGMLLRFIAFYILVALFSLVISCIFAWLLSLLTARLRRKNVINAVATLAFLGVYFYGYSRIQSYLSYLIVNGQDVARMLKEKIFPVYCMGKFTADGDVLSGIIFAACTLVPTMLMIFVLSKTFLKIATQKRGMKKRVYHEKELKVSGIRKTLIRKEWQHFINNPMYMLNSAMGVLFYIIVTVAVILKYDSFVEGVGGVDLGSLIPPAFGLLFCAIAATNILSAPSISIEGKNLWILQSLPCREKEILLAKADFHILVSAPVCVVCTVVLGVYMKCPVWDIVCMTLMPFMMNVMIGVLGVAINLKFPKLEWTNEIVVVKQSASAMISMFGGIGAVLIPGGIFLFLILKNASTVLFLPATILVMGLVSFLGRYYLTHKGEKVFREL